MYNATKVMRKITVLILLILSQESLAQNESVNGNLTIGTTGNSGNLMIRRGSDGNINGWLGFFGGGNEVHDLSLQSTSGGGFISFRTNYRGGILERVRIANNGNVGIGTTTPSARLHVQNGATNYSWVPTAGTVGILESTEATRAFLTLVGRSTGQSEIWFGDETRQNNGRIRYEHDIDHLRFWTAGSQQMTINHHGDVGIGTSNPRNKLQITNAFSFHDGGHEVIGFGWAHGDGADGDMDPSAYAGEIRMDPANGLLRLGVSETESSVPITAMTIDKIGNVGIGTFNPAKELHVVGGTRFDGNLELLRGSERLLWGSRHEGNTDHRNYFAPRNADNTAWDWSKEFGYHHYYQAWYFDTHVGIGTYQPKEKLHVAGTARIDGNIGLISDNTWKNGHHTLELKNSDAGDVVMSFHRGGYTSAHIKHSANFGGLTLAGNGLHDASHLQIDPSGKVGIGSVSPTEKLEIIDETGTRVILGTGTNNANSHNAIQFKHCYGGGGFTDGQVLSEIKSSRIGSSGQGAMIFSTSSDNDSHASEKMRIMANGDVGIGINSPEEKLHVRGTTRIDGNIGLISDKTWRPGQHTFELKNNDAGDVVMSFHRGGYTSAHIKHSADLGGLTLNGNEKHDASHLQIAASGKVGIGTTDFSGDHKLRVEGSIGAREIKVEANGWSDFVFEEGYELRTLEEVEAHITDKGHLPEIPSEAEVSEEGINLGEMNAKLLQKIEELTLYMIEQNKRMNKLEAKNAALEKQLSDLSQQ